MTTVNKNKNKIPITLEFLEDILQLSNFKIKITSVEQDPITNQLILHTEGSPFKAEAISLRYDSVPSEYNTQLVEIRAIQ